MDNIEIIPFSEENADYIRILNYEWISKYFELEESDIYNLNNPKTAILDKGGFIFYAKYQGEIVGTFSLIKMDDKTFELSKMATKEHLQGIGLGNKMLEFCLDFARNQKVSQIILFSNTILKPAIHLYQKFGFVEVPLANGVYKRADIKMQINL